MRALLILLMSAFFFGKDSTFTQSNTVRVCYRCFSSAFSFCEVTINEHISVTNYVYEIRLLNCFKSTINRKNNNDVRICWQDIVVSFFDVILFVKFSYWPKFYVNIITGSGVVTIFFYKELSRIPEIGNTLAWVLPNIWRLG